MDHEDCPAGRDERGRLYIKEVLPNGSYVAHCFNCGNSGAYFTGGYKNYRNLADLLKLPDLEDSKATVIHNGELPNRIQRQSKAIEYVPIKAWLYKFHLFEEDWDKLKLSEYSQSLVIPIYGDGVQLRYGFDNQTQKKYVTFLRTPKDGRFYQSPCTGSHEVLVLTEDVVSAYRIYRDLGIESFALLGKTISDELIGCVDSSYSKVFVWLDGDLAGKEAAIKVQLKLGSVRWSHIVNASCSPKELTPAELRDVAIANGIIK